MLDPPLAARYPRNCVVFSCRGKRPLASCLGGGDLDGDLYTLLMDRKLQPRYTSAPGGYPAAPDLKTSLPCTSSDLAVSCHVRIQRIELMGTFTRIIFYHTVRAHHSSKVPVLMNVTASGQRLRCSLGNLTSSIRCGKSKRHVLEELSEGFELAFNCRGLFKDVRGYRTVSKPKAECMEAVQGNPSSSGAVPKGRTKRET